jgi:hemolysin activation/secretion protein
MPKKLINFFLVLFWLTFFCLMPKTAHTEVVRIISRQEKHNDYDLQFEIKNNTVFSDQEIKALINPFLKSDGVRLTLRDRKITFDKLLQIRTKITNYYVSHGYVNSGAFIPSQNISSGKKIKIYIVEGKIREIEFEQESELNTYIATRLPQVNQILNIQKLERSLNVLEDDPLIKKIRVKLFNLGNGNTKLLVKVKAFPRFQTSFQITNSNSSNIGKNGLQFNAEYHALKYGDIFNLGLVKTQGLDKYSGQWIIPINIHNTKLSLSYVRAKSSLIDDSISNLDINANFNFYQIGINQPINIDFNQKINLEAYFNLIRSESFVLKDLSFAFIDGFANGKSNISELSLVQKYTNKKSNYIISLSSTFNIGLDIFNATKTMQGRDSIYWSWQLSANRDYKLSKKVVLISRFELQLSPDQVLPTRQFSIGGESSVRGYDKNLINGDNGIFVSNEIQYSLYDSDQSHLNLLAFLEAGSVWNKYKVIEEQNSLLSIGLGFNYSINDALFFELNHAIPLMNKQSPSSSKTTFQFSFSL